MQFRQVWLISLADETQCVQVKRRYTNRLHLPFTPADPNFGVLPYLWVHGLTEWDQIRRGNIYLEGALRRSHAIVCYTNASRGLSATSEFLVTHSDARYRTDMQFMFVHYLAVCPMLFFLSKRLHISANIFTARRHAQAWSLLWLGVRPSVCLSVTFVYSIPTVEDIVKLLYRPGSPTILVFWPPAPIPNSKGNPFSGD